MDFKKLKTALAAEAQALGICSEWYSFILKAPSKERLLTLYYKGFDFVEDNDFPSEKLRREFDDIRRDHNIYEAEAFNVVNPRRLVAYKDAKGSAEYNEFTVAQVWARPGSSINIKASDNAYVVVSVAEGANVSITADKQASVILFLHGGTEQHTAGDEAKIKIYKDK